MSITNEHGEKLDRGSEPIRNKVVEEHVAAVIRFAKLFGHNLDSGVVDYLRMRLNILRDHSYHTGWTDGFNETRKE